MKICHLTSSHTRYDTRIFRKECVSIANAGYDSTLIVADGKGDETKQNVQIIDVGKENSRKAQVLKSPKKILAEALKTDADLYHFHDPELIFIANKLKKKGKTVVYDVHEDVPRVLLTRSWLSPWIRRIIAFIFELAENFIAKKLDAIVVVTPRIKNRFARINKKVVQISNFPILNERAILLQPNRHEAKILCYIGAIDKVRGISELMDALVLLPEYKLYLAGNFESPIFQQEIQSHEAWAQVKYFGFVNRSEIMDILNKSSIGILSLLDTPNHRFSFPIKLFEYMMSGLPVIASNFRTWVDIIEDSNTGICIKPRAENIFHAVKKLESDHQLFEEMSKNGVKIVEEKYNWTIEENKLKTFYSEIIKRH